MLGNYLLFICAICACVINADINVKQQPQSSSILAASYLAKNENDGRTIYVLVVFDKQSTLSLLDIDYMQPISSIRLKWQSKEVDLANNNSVVQLQVFDDKFVLILFRDSSSNIQIQIISILPNLTMTNDLKSFYSSNVALDFSATFDSQSHVLFYSTSNTIGKYYTKNESSIIYNESINIATENIYSFIYLDNIYFIRNVKRKNLANRSNPENVIKLTRICLHDQSLNFKSQIDITLQCAFSPIDSPYEAKKANVVGTTKQDQHLLVYFEESRRRVRQLDSRSEVVPEVYNRICFYNLKDIEKAVDSIPKRCKIDGVKEPVPDIFSHNRVIAPCRKVSYFGQCSIPESADFYRLESYFPSISMKLLVFGPNLRLDNAKMTSLEIFSPAGGKLDEYIVMIASSAGQMFQYWVSAKYKNSYDIDEIPAPINLVPDAIWKYKRQREEQSVNNPAFVIVGPNLKPNFIFLIDGNQVKRHSVAACVFYSQCSACQLARRGEQINCGWCLSSRGNASCFPSNQCDANGDVFMQTICPPEIINVQSSAEIFASGNDEVRFVGENLNSRTGEVVNITICDAPCRIKYHRDNEISCSTSPMRSSGIDNTCSVAYYSNVTLPADFDKPERIVVTYRKTNLNLQLIGRRKESEKHAGTISNKSLWIGLVFAAIVVVVLSVGIYICWRRRGFRPKRILSSIPSFDGSSRYASRYTSAQERVRMNYGSNGDYLTPSSSYEPWSYELIGNLVPPQLIIPSDKLILLSPIGHGHFGNVYKGEYIKNQDESQLVAVKTLHVGATVVRRAFLEEGMLMSELSHPNILPLVGISLSPSPECQPMIITPYMELGDLLTYLRNPNSTPNLRQLMQFAGQIADGMCYLVKMKLIHRDLAARNCMLDSQFVIKIADFGLSRDVYESDLYQSRQHQHVELPLKWMAPEAVQYGTFDSTTDVWSYGVLLWEIFTRGEIPYQEVRKGDLMIFLNSGNRLIQPEFCPDPVYELMLKCWSLISEVRPTFAFLSIRVPEIVQEIAARPRSEPLPLPNPMPNFTIDTPYRRIVNERAVGNFYS